MLVLKTVSTMRGAEWKYVEAWTQEVTTHHYRCPSIVQKSSSKLVKISESHPVRELVRHLKLDGSQDEGATTELSIAPTVNAMAK